MSNTICRRRSRWTEEGSKTYIPGMPTMIPEGLTPQQQKVKPLSPQIRFAKLTNTICQAYLLQLKIEEASWRLRSGDLGIPHNPEDRSGPQILFPKLTNTQNSQIHKYDLVPQVSEPGASVRLSREASEHA
jgi:hypothetical protein